MFYLLDMAHERRQACPSVVVKEKQWSFNEKGPLGYGRTLIAYAGSGPPRHSTSTPYDRPGGVFTIAILKNHDQPFYKILKTTGSLQLDTDTLILTCTELTVKYTCFLHPNYFVSIRQKHFVS